MNAARPTLNSVLTPERLADLKRGAPTVRQRAHQAMHNAGLVMTGSVQERMATATPYRPAVLYADPNTISSRHPFAVMRFNRILEGLTKSSNIETAVRTAEHPELVKQCIETWVYYMTRTRPAPAKGVDHNPFRHLTDLEASKKFQRLLEDIADRSTGVFGPWYVK